MLSKISSMLDAVADSLEKKGLIKEAYEIDKVADILSGKQQIFETHTYEELKKMADNMLNLSKQIDKSNLPSNHEEEMIFGLTSEEALAWGASYSQLAAEKLKQR